MKGIILKLALFIVLGTGLSGCMVSGGLIIHPEPIIIGDPPQKAEHSKKYVRRGKGKKMHVRIPPGHMPARGECRIWFYDRPPGHQPPPAACHRIDRRIPYGAVLVRG